MYLSRGLGGNLSPFVHYFIYRFKKPRMRLERAMLIVSVDVDVGNKKVGSINKGKNDTNVNDHFSEHTVGEMEEQALPLVIDFFNAFDIPVTFGIRGQLLEVDTSVIEHLLESPVQHDVGSHSYYHRDFMGLSYDEAENELTLASATMKKFGITPKSFIFPRGDVAHLELLEKFGYKCYRGYGDFINDGMYIKKHGKLYDIHPSLYIGSSTNAILIKKIIDLSIKNRLPFHMWFHPWNLGKEKKSTRKKIDKLFFPIFKYAKSKEKACELKFETMLSAAEKMAHTDY